MKKFLTGLLVLLLFVGFIGSASVYANMGGNLPTEANTTITANMAVNGKLVYFPDERPYLNEDGRTMVPLRFPSETLGADVQWLEATRQVKITLRNHATLPNKDLLCTIGSSAVTVNNQTKYMDTVPIIVNSRTMVPLRFISEYLGAVVDWHEDSRVAHVFTEGQSKAEQARIMEQVAKDMGVTSKPTVGTKPAEKFPALSAEKVVELKAKPILLSTPDATFDEVSNKKYDLTYTNFLKNMVLKDNQSFASDRSLMYIDSLHDYCVRGILTTYNVDGSISEVEVEVHAYYGASSRQENIGWHPAYICYIDKPELVQE